MRMSRRHRSWGSPSRPSRRAVRRVALRRGAKAKFLQIPCELHRRGPEAVHVHQPVRGAALDERAFDGGVVAPRDGALPNVAGVVESRLSPARLRRIPRRLCGAFQLGGISRHKYSSKGSCAVKRWQFEFRGSSRSTSKDSWSGKSPVWSPRKLHQRHHWQACETWAQDPGL